MNNGVRYTIIGALLCIMSVAISGCSVKFYRGHPEDIDKIHQLSDRVKQIEDAKTLLEQRLKNEIRDKQVKLDITKRGLVITFVDEILFDSGKAELKKDAYPVLDKVVGVIKEKVRDRNIGIEGHTDNQPIKYSGWKSNWELSAARATTVLHYLEEAGINPAQLQAVGYGEYRPVSTNDTKEGRRQNRRVEVVILPDADVDKVTLDNVPGASGEEYTK